MLLTTNFSACVYRTKNCILKNFGVRKLAKTFKTHLAKIYANLIIIITIIMMIIIMPLAFVIIVPQKPIDLHCKSNQ